MPECYTKKKNDGGTYTTCVEFQDKPKKKKLNIVAPKPKKTKLKIVAPPFKYGDVVGKVGGGTTQKGYRTPNPSITISEDSTKSFSTSDARNVIGPYQPTSVGFKIGKNPVEEEDEEEDIDPEESDSEEEEGNWWESEGSEVEPFNYRPEIYGPNKFLLNKETKEVFDYEGELMGRLLEGSGRIYFNRLGDEYETKLANLKKRTDLIDRLVREGKGDELQEILRRVKADPSKTGVEHYDDIIYEKTQTDKGPVVQADDEEGPLEAGTPANKDSIFYEREFKKLIDEVTKIEKAENPRKDIRKLEVGNANYFINTLIGAQGAGEREREYGITTRYAINRGLKSAIKDLDYRRIGRSLAGIAKQPGWRKVINEGILDLRRRLEFASQERLERIAKENTGRKEEARATLLDEQEKASTRIKEKYEIGDIINFGGGSYLSDDAMRGYVRRRDNNYKITGFAKTGVSLKKVDGTDRKFRRYTDF